MEEKKQIKWIFVIMVSIIVLICSIVGIISTLKQRNEHQKRLESFMTYLYDYCNSHYGDNWYVDGENHINVHIWEPGTSMAITLSPLNELEVRAKYEDLAKKMNKSAWDYDLGYGVTLLLHNDLDTEKILMIWINGKYWEGD